MLDIGKTYKVVVYPKAGSMIEAKLEFFILHLGR